MTTSSRRLEALVFSVVAAAGLVALALGQPGKNLNSNFAYVGTCGSDDAVPTNTSTVAAGGVATDTYTCGFSWTRNGTTCNATTTCTRTISQRGSNAYTNSRSCTGSLVAPVSSSCNQSYALTPQAVHRSPGSNNRCVFSVTAGGPSVFVSRNCNNMVTSSSNSSTPNCVQTCPAST